LLGQRGCVLWLSGLSGAGKSTIAYALEARLLREGHQSFVLDGDNVRQGLCGDLGFSAEDRHENIRRVSHLAALFADAGMLTISSCISPYAEDRMFARETIGVDRFLEIFLDVPLEVCEKRDPKGLYKKVRDGLISGFTGIDSPYQVPVNPSLSLDTHALDVDDCLDLLVALLVERGFVLPAERDGNGPV
jgi:adenylyl-sulfate kinase